MATKTKSTRAKTSKSAESAESAEFIAQEIAPVIEDAGDDGILAPDPAPMAPEPVLVRIPFVNVTVKEDEGYPLHFNRWVTKRNETLNQSELAKANSELYDIIQSMISPEVNDEEAIRDNLRWLINQMAIHQHGWAQPTQMLQFLDDSKLPPRDKERHALLLSAMHELAVAENIKEASAHIDWHYMSQQFETSAWVDIMRQMTHGVFKPATPNTDTN